MYVVSLISRYMENPTKIHLLAAKRIFRYLQGTRYFGLFYKKTKKLELFGFTDSDYARDQDDRKSTTGYVFMLGTGVISWSYKEQPILFVNYRSWIYCCNSLCLSSYLVEKNSWRATVQASWSYYNFFLTTQQSNSPRILCYMEEANILMWNIIF